MNQENQLVKRTSLLSKILIFFVVLYMGLLIESVIQMIFIVISLLSKMNVGNIIKILSDDKLLTDYIYGSYFLTLVSLFSTIGLILATIFWCIKIDKHSFEYIGLKKENIFKNYGIGFLVGFIMFSSVFVLEIITGCLKFDNFNTFNILSIILLILFFIGFIIQSASEEIICRGFFLNNIKSQHGVLLGLIISSVLFSLMHIFNGGFSIIPLINIFLVGIFFGLYYLSTKNLWGVCAAHGIWNFAQGNIYGIKVSGISLGNSIINSLQVEGRELLNGGKFGAEGGLITTIVLVVSILILLLYMKKKKIYIE